MGCCTNKPTKKNNDMETFKQDKSVSSKEIENFDSKIKDKTVEANYSEVSESLYMKARICTPVNGSLRYTLTSSESEISSQILYSEQNESISQIEKNRKTEGSTEKYEKFEKFEETEDNKKIQDYSPLNEQKKDSSTIIQKTQQVNSIDVRIDYNRTKEFVIFLLDILQVNSKKFEKFDEGSEKFTLFDLERLLNQLPFNLYPIETFKVIVKTLDLLFEASPLTKIEKKQFLQIFKVNSNNEYIEKQGFVSSILFRLKLITLKAIEESYQ